MLPWQQHDMGLQHMAFVKLNEPKVTCEVVSTAIL